MDEVRSPVGSLGMAVATAGDTLSERLFGVVIERYGRFKFASYQNQY